LLTLLLVPPEGLYQGIEEELEGDPGHIHFQAEYEACLEGGVREADTMRGG